MDTLLIKNASLVTPDEVLENASLKISDGVITEISEGEPPTADRAYDAEGAYVMAGFIDLHVHGGGGADFMDDSPEAFECAVKAHLAHGTTTLFPTSVAASRDALISFIKAYQCFKKSSKYASIAEGVHLEGPYFFGAGLAKGAQKGDVLRLPDLSEARELCELAGEDIKRWDIAPELPLACELGKYLDGLGILAAVGHTDATAEETSLAYASGFKHVNHFLNATSAHRKRGQTVYAGVFEATYLDDSVSIELIADGCHIAKEDFLLALKIKGAEMISAVTDGTRFSGSSLKFGKLGSIKDGTDVLVEDGVAKLLDKTSFAGSTATMDRCLRVLVSDFGIPISKASVMLSYAPARRMDLADRKGKLAVGYDADIAIVTKDLKIKDIFKMGHRSEEL